jgi:hypothetical protein
VKVVFDTDVIAAGLVTEGLCREILELHVPGHTPILSSVLWESSSARFGRSYDEPRWPGCARRCGRLGSVPPTLEDGLRALDQASAFAASYRFDLTPDYLALIATVEALPGNRALTDKSHVWHGERAFRDFFAKARRAPLDP